LLLILTVSWRRISTAVLARSKLDPDVLTACDFHLFRQTSECAIAGHGHSLTNFLIRAIDKVNGSRVLLTEAGASHGDEGTT
jgi:hypothetical protein